MEENLKIEAERSKLCFGKFKDNQDEVFCHGRFCLSAVLESKDLGEAVYEDNDPSAAHQEDTPVLYESAVRKACAIFVTSLDENPLCIV